MKRIILRIVLVVGGMTVGLALCEGLIWVTPERLLPPRLQELSERMALYRSTDGMFIPDSELLFKIRPNYDAVVDHPDYHVRVKTHLNLDDIGFRGGSLGGPTWGIAVGDSFTFGVGVEQQDSWVYLLAKGLSRDIVNLAIPAQGPAQYTRVLKRYGLPMAPKIVFYSFYFNDLDASHRFYRMKRTLIPVSRYLRHYSVLYNLVRDRRVAVAPVPAARPGAGAEPIDDGRAIVAPVAPSAANDDADLIRKTLHRQDRKFEARWQVTVEELDAALRATQEAQVELVMLYLPSRWEIHWEAIKGRNRLPDSLDIDRLRRTFVEYCRGRKIACLDLTPMLKQAARQGENLYFPIDGHWNKEGNRLVAEALKNFLTARGLTGEIS